MSTPVQQKQVKTRRKGEPPKPRSRYETMGGKDADVVMPIVSYGTWLINALWSIGPVNADGSAVSWAEIDAWARMTRRTLTGWESETLRKMSEAYAIQVIKAREPACPAPYMTIMLKGDALNRKILDVFAPLVAKKKEPAQHPAKTGKKKVKSG